MQTKYLLLLNDGTDEIYNLNAFDLKVEEDGILRLPIDDEDFIGDFYLIMKTKEIRDQVIEISNKSSQTEFEDLLLDILSDLEWTWIEKDNK